MSEVEKAVELDFKGLQAQVVEEIKAGRALTGVGGVLRPLIKQIIEASLEGELEAHLQEVSEASNRRNGKLKRLWVSRPTELPR